MSTQSSSLNSAGFQEVEARIAGWLPAIAARVYWQEEVQVVMHLPSGNTRNITCSCYAKRRCSVQTQCCWDEELLCSLYLYLAHRPGHGAEGRGQTNLGMRMEDVANPAPALRLYDLLSWRRKAKPSCAWSGFQRCKPALSTIGG